VTTPHKSDNRTGRSHNDHPEVYDCHLAGKVGFGLGNQEWSIQAGHVLSNGREHAGEMTPSLVGDPPTRDLFGRVEEFAFPLGEGPCLRVRLDHERLRISGIAHRPIFAST
jgi:hypothetical protein